LKARPWGNGNHRTQCKTGHGPEWESIEAIGAKDSFDDGSRKGRAKIFEVRRIYNDVSFIDEFLTEEFVERHKMYQHQRDPQTGEVRIVSRDFKRVKMTLLHHLTNMGQPFIYIVDANYLNRGELYLAHQFAGLEVDASKAEQVMSSLRVLWGRPVHLQVRINDEMHLLTVREPGERAGRERISEETPKPANWLK